MMSRAGLWLPWLLTAAACASGPPVRVYVLTAPLERAAPAASSRAVSSPAASYASAVPGAASASLEVRRVLVPDYLDTTDILLRDGRNEIKVDPTGRWGERLSDGLTQALAADLAARLPRESVVLDASDRAGRRLLVSVQALDLWPDGHCVMAADWSLVEPGAKTAAITGSGRFDTGAVADMSSASDANRVDAIARTVAKLADAIAAQEFPAR